ncbi:hypothetical protein [Paenibacillus polymyxa]|uniref:hypothetical protein n=1 Tax=Paenibacillus polymyxa TaxID=1406 RepID=UPI0032173E34
MEDIERIFYKMTGGKEWLYKAEHTEQKIKKNNFQSTDLIVGGIGSGRTFIDPSLQMRLYAKNRVDEKCEVHYIDLSFKEDRFNGLPSECFTYSDKWDLRDFLSYITENFNDRMLRYQNNQSLENDPVLYVIAVHISDDEVKDTFINTLQRMAQFNRAAKYVFLLNEITFMESV